MDGAMGVLVHFSINPDYPMLQMSEAMDIVYESAHEDADVIFGTTTDVNIPLDKVIITIVATGFEEEEAKAEEPKQEEVVDFVRPTLSRQKVVGEDFGSIDYDMPTFMRRQLD